ncbi:MAG: hypothetical protein IKP37_04785 [Paludibacteraceae bacterium]|nr:hypothetical protein [Paludibacteraceae bacterium]
MARSVFQTHIARAGSRARWNGGGHSNIPGYRDTVFQTDSKSKKEFAQAELVMEVPSS